ncbi:MAG: M24 family metallopeptidase [Pseudorhodoplanes sp.]
MVASGSVEIPADEFQRRRERAVAEARKAGLAGLLVCARGGGTVDRYGDVMYLTNHYSAFPYIPDLAGAWSGRGHCYFVMPVDDEPRLVIDTANIDSVKLPTDQIEITELVIETTAEILRRKLSKGRIGLVGADVLPSNIAKAFEAAVPDARWENADPILAGLRAIKSPAELAKLRAASAIGSRMIDAMMQAAQPGATHGDVVAAGTNVLIPAGGILYNSFMASGTGGSDPTIVRSTFPTWASKEPLKQGQWFRVGISGVLDGYYFDLARSRPIGGSATNAQIAAFEAAVSVIEAGTAAMRVGAEAGAVADAGLNKQEELGFAWKGVFSGLGHGIGLGWDAPWLVRGEKTKLQPGMVFCLEKTLMRDGYLGDFEETVVMTENGPELITDARIRYW